MIDVLQVARILSNNYKNGTDTKLLVGGQVITIESDGSGLGIELPIGTDLESCSFLAKDVEGNGPVNISIQVESDSVPNLLLLNGAIRVNNSVSNSEWIYIDPEEISAVVL